MGCGALRATSDAVWRCDWAHRPWRASRGRASGRHAGAKTPHAPGIGSGRLASPHRATTTLAAELGQFSLVHCQPGLQLVSFRPARERR